jgi:hypothetical protein
LDVVVSSEFVEVDDGRSSEDEVGDVAVEVFLQVICLSLFGKIGRSFFGNETTHLE